jgi:hypothetical protein
MKFRNRFYRHKVNCMAGIRRMYGGIHHPPCNPAPVVGMTKKCQLFFLDHVAVVIAKENRQISVFGELNMHI